MRAAADHEPRRAGQGAARGVQHSRHLQVTEVPCGRQAHPEVWIVREKRKAVRALRDDPIVGRTDPVREGKEHPFDLGGGAFARQARMEGERARMNSAEAHACRGLKPIVRGKLGAGMAGEHVVPLREGERGSFRDRKKLLCKVGEHEKPRQIRERADAVEGCPRLGGEVERRELQREMLPHPLDAGVHTRRMRLQQEPLLIGERLVDAPLHVRHAQHPAVPIQRKGRRTRHFREPARGEAADDLHLPEPVLGVHETLGKEQVLRPVGANVGNAPRVTDDFNLGNETGKRDAAPCRRLPTEQQDPGEQLRCILHPHILSTAPL